MQELKAKWYKKWWGITLILFLFILGISLVSLAFYIYDLSLGIREERIIKEYNQRQENVDKNRRMAENNIINVMGSQDPKITIVEFADFACSYSKESAAKIRQLATKYKKDIKVIYRDYPLHEESIDLALAARCAGEQGLFWLMHDNIFKNFGVFEKERLIAMAEEVGANKAKFTDCLNSQKYLNQVKKDFSDAENLKIEGTPTWFLNGYKIAGDVPMETWEEIINKFLQK